MQPLRSKLSLPPEVNEVEFLQRTQGIATKLGLSLWQGISAFETKTGGKEGFLTRLQHQLFPGRIDEKAFHRIYNLWNKSLEALYRHQSCNLVDCIGQLELVGKIFPFEFKATLPDMTPMEVSRTLNHLKAMGYLFATLEATRKRDFAMVKRSLDTSVSYFHEAGIPKDDPSLNKYYRVFMGAVSAIEKR